MASASYVSFMFNLGIPPNHAQKSFANLNNMEFKSRYSYFCDIFNKKVDQTLNTSCPVKTFLPRGAIERLRHCWTWTCDPITWSNPPIDQSFAWYCTLLSDGLLDMLCNTRIMSICEYLLVNSQPNTAQNAAITKSILEINMREAQEPLRPPTASPKEPTSPKQLPKWPRSKTPNVAIQLPSVPEHWQLPR